MKHGNSQMNVVLGPQCIQWDTHAMGIMRRRTLSPRRRKPTFSTPRPTPKAGDLDSHDDERMFFALSPHPMDLLPLPCSRFQKFCAAFVVCIWALPTFSGLEAWRSRPRSLAERHPAMSVLPCMLLDGQHTSPHPGGGEEQGTHPRSSSVMSLLIARVKVFSEREGEREAIGVKRDESPR